MTINYAKHVSTRQTPQNEPIPGSNQVENSAGGYTWKVDHWTQLNRFLILGAEGGTYYIKEQKLTQKNCKSVLVCIKENAKRVVDTLVTISDSGRAPKNDPALFVLALVMTSADNDGRRYAAEAINKVCRIGTHLFTLTEYVNELRSWGRVIRDGFAHWYNEKEPASLAYQMTKYANRNGWTHLDVLRSAHVKPATDLHNLLFRYAKSGYYTEMAGKIPYLDAVDAVKNAKTAKEAVKLITENNLPREVIPTELLNEVSVWDALLEKMPMTAMIRNLGKMTSVGLIGAGKFAKNSLIVDRLTNVEALKKARVHPLSILVALATYQGGKGLKGSLSWNPSRQVIDALDSAFYLAFGAVEPTGKNHLLAIDVSGSMSWDTSRIAGTPIFPRQAATAMALVTAAVEKNYEICVFSSSGYGNNGITATKISPRMRLDAAMAELDQYGAGGTDCSLPILWAKERKVDIDAFIVYTDNETWAGNIHASQALKMYRNEMNKPEAKLITVGMASNGFTIADPADHGMLDVVGFDTGTPNVMGDFIKGNI